jgi:membrane associated rhomboid family serine protease
MKRDYSPHENKAPIAEVRIVHEDDIHDGPHPTAPVFGHTNPYPAMTNARVTPVMATEVTDGYPPRKNSDPRAYHQPNETDSYEENSYLDNDRNSQLSSIQTSLPTATNARSGDASQLYHVLNSGGEASPALERRLRDFRFAQKKRREKYGDERPWGILGLYDYLTGVRTDVEWAEDAAWRREHDEPYLSWTDFDSSKDTGLNRPFFTYIFMIICTFFLILSIGLNGWTIEQPSVNPMIGPSADTLIRIGAKYTPLMFGENQWWRLVSPMVLHAGVIHYAVNMLAFWFIGKAIEQSHGFIVTAFLFIVPAFGGTILSALFLRQYISVGASGGIFGLIGL